MFVSFVGRRRRLVVVSVGLLAIVAACGSSTTSTGTGFGGKWTGQLLQPKTSGNTQFDYTMNLTESGSSISGTAHISVLNQAQYYADFTVTGTVTGAQLTYTELKITGQVPPNTGGSWCLKQGIVTLSNGGNTLSGSWTSPSGCAPGTLSLTRS